MVMKIESESIVSLKIAISYDDGITKVQVVSEGDFVKVAYNYNGVRRVICGTVSSIHANPYAATISKNDWYFEVVDENPNNNPHVAKIMVNSVLDLEVLHKKYQSSTVGSPNDPTRITDIRVLNGYFQISQNNGYTWRTIDMPLSDKPVPPDDQLALKIMAMIGSDQYATSEELIQGLADLVREEADKNKHRPWSEYPTPPAAPMPNDIYGNYANPPAHSAGMSAGPQHPDFRYN